MRMVLIAYTQHVYVDHVHVVCESSYQFLFLGAMADSKFAHDADGAAVRRHKRRCLSWAEPEAVPLASRPPRSGPPLDTAAAHVPTHVTADGPPAEAVIQKAPSQSRAKPPLPVPSAQVSRPPRPVRVAVSAPPGPCVKHEIVEPLPAVAVKSAGRPLPSVAAKSAGRVKSEALPATPPPKHVLDGGASASKVARPSSSKQIRRSGTEEEARNLQ